MRKIVVIIFAIVLFNSQVKAQDFRFGLTASPLISWFNVAGTDVENDGSRLGFQYGLLFEPTIGSVERYAFSTGLVVNMVGGFLNATEDYSMADTALTGVVNTSLRVQYIEVPLTIKLRTNEINYFSYYGLFGVTPGFNIKARYDQQAENGDFIHEDVNLNGNEDGVDDEYRLLNLSLSMGIGTEYSITETTTLTAGLMFQNGFLNVYESSATDEMIQMKQMVLRLGVLF